MNRYLPLGGCIVVNSEVQKNTSEARLGKEQRPLGIILWFVNLGSLLQKKLSAFFSKMNQLGVWSYYIFLTHYLLVFITQKMDDILTPLLNNSPIGIKVLRVSLFGAIIVGTWITSGIVQRFDCSQFSDLMIQKTFVKVLK